MGTSIPSNGFAILFYCKHVYEPTHVKGNVLDLVPNVVDHLTIHPPSAKIILQI